MTNSIVLRVEDCETDLYRGTVAGNDLTAASSLTKEGRGTIRIVCVNKTVFIIIYAVITVFRRNDDYNGIAREGTILEDETICSADRDPGQSGYPWRDRRGLRHKESAG